jgi:hypothetical protein
VKFNVWPTQDEPPVLSVGVTEIIEDNGALELLLAEVKPGTFPVPLELSPMAEFPLTQVNVVAEALLPKIMGLVNVPLQITRSVTGSTVGDGTICKLKVNTVPAQETPLYV